MKKGKVIKGMYWFDTGIFPATVMFIFGFTYDETIAELKKKKADTWAMAISEDRELMGNSNYLAMKRSLENTKTGKFVDHYIIKITEPFKFEDYDYCRLAHEVLHICQYFLPDVLKRDKEHEAEAYLHTYLMQKCLVALRGDKSLK
jgi:hypothetical protein